MKKLIILILACLLISCSATEVVSLGEGPMTTSAYYYDSGKSGLKIAIIGGIHGDEVAGWQAADQIHENIEDYISTGSVLIIPHANQIAIDQERRYGEGYTDLNRTFLGQGDVDSVNLSSEIKTLIVDFDPDLVIDHHESLDSYKNNRLGNSIIITDVSENLLKALDILDIINAKIVDDIPFIIESSPPEGSINRTLSETLEVLVITIETNRELEIEKRIEEQIIVFESILEYME